MKNLDLLNPAFARPSSLCSFGAVIPLILSLSSIALSSSALKNTASLNNPLSLVLIFIAIVSFLMIFWPRIFKWNWSAKYFLVSSFEMGCVGMLGGVPWLCLLFYSTIFLPYRIALFLSYLLIISIHSRRIAAMYRDLRSHNDLLSKIYQTENNVTYYLQKNDVNLIEKKYKLSLFPKGIYFIVFPLLAFCTIPLSNEISDMIGLPYPHIFLGIFSIPIDMMALAFIARGLFVFHHLPKYLKKTSSTVYVDMVSKTKI